MSETTLSILVFLHLIFIAIWVGGQVIIAAVTIPSARRIEDPSTRLQVIEGATRRFGFVAGLSMVAIVLTGGLMVGERIDHVAPGDLSIFDRRWGWIFVIKMAVWAMMVVVVGLHTFFTGPRQLELNREAIVAGEAEPNPDLRRYQLRSILLSITGLLLSLVVLGAGAFLANHNFSFQAA